MGHMNNSISRRHFIGQTLIAGGVFHTGTSGWLRGQSANDKLSIGIIGVDGRGGANLNGVAHHHIAALCDVDSLRLDKASQRFPEAKTYTDFRDLIDHKGLDAVVVSTPDHTHAVAAVSALEKGLHVYCEKPLARTVSEVRRIRETAKASGKITQMGTQIHAGNNYRRVVELIQTGAIGKVLEVHVWAGAVYGGKEAPTDRPPVPEHLDYDLWTGPVPKVPYHPDYVPFHWRNWWRFGGGGMADFGCHHKDLAFWALGLREPMTVEVLDGPEKHPHSTPPWMKVKYEYPLRGRQDPLPLYWYQGGKRPPLFETNLLPEWGDGNLFVGTEGMLLAGYSNYVLLPESKFVNHVKPSPFIPNSIGHHEEWLQACMGKGSTTCHFEYGGLLTEAVLLGNVAFRSACKIEWNASAMEAKGCPQADEFINHHYRKGWTLG